jgi:hypothetical protein
MGNLQAEAREAREKAEAEEAETERLRLKEFTTRLREAQTCQLCRYGLNLQLNFADEFLS